MFILRTEATKPGRGWWGLGTLLKGTHPSFHTAYQPKSQGVLEAARQLVISPSLHPFLAIAPKSNWTAHVSSLNGKHTHTQTRTLTNLISSLFYCPSLCFFLLILLCIYFCFPSHSLGASSQDLLYSLGQRTFVLFQWEYVLFPSQHLMLLVCVRLWASVICVLQKQM